MKLAQQQLKKYLDCPMLFSWEEGGALCAVPEGYTVAEIRAAEA
jgi:hypothetical protein